MYALAVTGSTVYAGGGFTSIGGLLRSNLAAIVDPATGVPSSTGEAPLAFAQVIPNPSAGRARIECTLSREAHVRVRVFDVLGREIARLMDEVRPAGRAVTAWDGDGPTGTVPSGVYFVRFETGGSITTRRLVLLR